MPKKKAQQTEQAPHSACKYPTAEALQAACDAYFARCDEKGELYGEAGLCLALGVTLSTYRKWRHGDSSAHLMETVQMADLRIQHQLETDARYQEKSMVTKAIFMMKQPQFGGYQDRIEARQDIAVNVKMGAGMDESDFK
jgi:hypothetical protein